MRRLEVGTRGTEIFITVKSPDSSSTADECCKALRASFQSIDITGRECLYPTRRPQVRFVVEVVSSGIVVDTA